MIGGVGMEGSSSERSIVLLVRSAMLEGVGDWMAMMELGESCCCWVLFAEASESGSYRVGLSEWLLVR